jgi:hypothetical protein
MTEPAVTLTDFALALQCAAILAVVGARAGFSERTAPWLLYFAAAGVASLCGGLVHGYFLDPGSAGRAIFWPASLIAIGVNALATCAIGAGLLLSPQITRRLVVPAVATFAAYCLIVMFVDDSFAVAVSVAAPAALFLLAALLWVYGRARPPGALAAAAGVAVTLAAAAVQQLGMAIHPTDFNHNATAHVVQAASLALMFAGCLRLLSARAADSTRSMPCNLDAIS